MEYDREGFRYDGQAGLFHGGGNPAPKSGDYFTVENGILVDEQAEWNSGGVSEVDCLMCHMRRTKPTDTWYPPRQLATFMWISEAVASTPEFWEQSVDIPAVDPNIFCVDLDRDGNCDDPATLDTTITPQSNTIVNPRISATADYYADGSGPASTGLVINGARSLCNIVGGCTYNWYICADAPCNVAAMGGPTVSGSTPGLVATPGAGLYYVTLVLTHDDGAGHVVSANKTVAAWVEAPVLTLDNATASVSLSGPVATVTIDAVGDATAVMIDWNDASRTDSAVGNGPFTKDYGTVCSDGGFNSGATLTYSVGVTFEAEVDGKIAKSITDRTPVTVSCP